MKKWLLILGIIGLSLTMPAQAQAVFIVDTGAGPADANGVEIGFNFTNWERIAGQFSISDSYTVNSLEGWISTLSTARDGGLSDIVVYGDNADSVDVGNELFRGSFTIANNTVGWQGVSGGSLFSINPGTYWIAVEMNEASADAAAMPQPVGNPLALHRRSEAYGVPNYSNIEDYSVGFRIDADLVNPNAVPEPATMALFATGFAGAFWRRRSAK